MDGVLYYEWPDMPDRRRLVVLYWRGLKSQVYKKCKSCITCASVKGQGHRGRPLLVSIPVGDAFECIGMDFIGLECSKAGNKYALVLQDYLTKWPEV